MNRDSRHDQPVDEQVRRAQPLHRVSRRGLFQRSGVVAVSVGVGAANSTLAQTDDGTPIPTAEQYPNVPSAPETPPDPGQLEAFTDEEAGVVDALTARILPGSAEDPGAREAGVVTFIDHKLAAEGGFAEKVYRRGPWARAYQGDTPPSPEPDVVWIRGDQILRYGYQSSLTPLEVFQHGIAAVSRFAEEQFGRRLVDLSEAEQDQIVQALADGTASGFEETPFTARAFFHCLRRNTMEGLFSDPAYGGNRDMVGWRLIGYPGAQRAYLPVDIITEGTDRQPQALADLNHFHPGRPEHGEGHEPMLPVSGSDDDA